MEGTVFNIQRFCVQDGPGVRTTVFMKGCPLRCAWCHNPESHSGRPEMLFDPSRCILCGACAAACGRHDLRDGAHRYDRDGCEGCGRCASACYAGALELCGRTMTVGEVLDAVERDRPFYGEEGGMTLSGGEPLFQPEFAVALAKGARARGIRVCVETSGAGGREALMALAAHTDLFLYDVKLLDSARHRQYTGAPNEAILGNLAALSASGAQIVLRCPVIPGVNLDDGHFAGIARLADGLAGVREVQFEPYHPLGVSKCERLGRAPACADRSFLDRSTVAEFAERAQSLTRIRLTVQ